jgi:molecular chaperone GrpE
MTETTADRDDKVTPGAEAEADEKKAAEADKKRGGETGKEKEEKKKKKNSEKESKSKAESEKDSEKAASEKAEAGESIESEPEPEDEEEKKEEKKEDEEAWDDKYKRLLADFQNYKRRTEKEKADVYSFANEQIVTELLQVLDNFERALASECSDKAYADGMEMIFKQFSGILTKSGLEEIDAVGKDFDPNFHHAVLKDNNDDFESGQVTEVLQKGYTFKKKVIRPAMVKVNE